MFTVCGPGGWLGRTRQELPTAHYEHEKRVQVSDWWLIECEPGRGLTGSWLAAEHAARAEDRRTASEVVKRCLEQLRWVTCEPHSEHMWDRVILEVRVILEAARLAGELVGDGKDSYGVHCGPSTMTQTDIDDGVLNVALNLALRKPGVFTTARLRFDVPTDV